jgi:acyl carrier protein
MSQIDAILDIVAQVSLVDRAILVLDAKVADLGITSLDMVEIIFALEEKFGIELPFNANTSAQGYRTLGDVIAVVEKTIAEVGTA